MGLKDNKKNKQEPEVNPAEPKVDAPEEPNVNAPEDGEVKAEKKAEEEAPKESLGDAEFSGPASRPYRTLANIEKALNDRYPIPSGVSFSSDPDEKIIQQAVLFHRLRGAPEFRDGQKNFINDNRFREMAKVITEGKDPVAEYIKSAKDMGKKKDLLSQIMVADTRKAFFETMLFKSAEKKVEAESVSARPRGALYAESPRQRTEAKLEQDALNIQSGLFKKLADNPGATTEEVLFSEGTEKEVKRLLAIKLHGQQVEHEMEELRKAYEYEGTQRREQLMNERESFSCEKAADRNTDAYLKALADTPEVDAMYQRMLKTRSLNELSALVSDPPKPAYIRHHDSLAKLENIQMRGAIEAFLKSKDAPEQDSSIYKALKDMLDSKGKDTLSDDAPDEECEERAAEYKKIIKMLEKNDLHLTEAGKKLKEDMEKQAERLEDMAVDDNRKKIEFDYRENTLVDYFDPDDPTNTPMDAVQAREQLLRGKKLQQKIFVDGSFIGSSREVSLDKETGMIKKGPEKVISRFVDLSKKNENKPTMQIEDLRTIKEVLKRSNPFYVKNSASFNKTMETLEKVIKAQENLDRDANVRQVRQLKNLYKELDSDVEQYISEKSERMKVKGGDDRGNLRMDTMKTLQSITGAKHVNKVANQLFDEQAKLDMQQKMLEPCKQIMDIWRRNGTPTTAKGIADFKKDYDALAIHIGKIQRSIKDLSYFKMGLAESLQEFNKQAENVQLQIKDPKERINGGRLDRMKAFADDSEAALQKLYAMDDTIITDDKQKSIQVRNKVRDPLVM